MCHKYHTIKEDYMLIKEFSRYDDGFYFLYVTDTIRIETDGSEGLQMEDRNYKVSTIENPWEYSDLDKSQYFQYSLVNPHIDTVIDAVQTLKGLEMIENFTCGRYAIHNNNGVIEYLIDDVPVQLVELPSDSYDRITLEVLSEIYHRENTDSGLKWEE